MWLCKDMCFDKIWGRRKVGNKSQLSAILANNLIPYGLSGRGRRERRSAGEEEEEGLLRTVVCVFKS